MLAPFTPHITEEIWNDMYRKESIHRSDWPETEGLKIDLEKGDNAMKAISALRKFKSDNQMPLNSKIKSAEVSADISGFEDAVKEVMHVKKLEQREDSPDLETKIKEIKLNYANAGPEYGDKIGEIEDALENNEFMVEDGRLEVADERLKPEMFTVVEEKEYTGDGKLVDGDVPVVVKQ